ncbi:MAG: tRNA lysidine(34) synthetase TilS [Actinomycetia bacterium]|nr:tRNA lysidine(34) synthetase TilS [Actinomycetes bacterium]
MGLPILTELIDAATPLVVMLSGGSDSVALLRLLAAGAFGERTPALEHIRVLHVNHGLRAEAAHADEAFVVELCEQLGYVCVLSSVDVAARAAAEKRNVEDMGRQLRYEAAEELCDELCAELAVDPGEGRIATAHTRDDRVETFFERALLGAGPGALASIRARRGRIVRPLLRCDRAALRAWLRELGQDWREDATNEDTTRTRAFIRARIVSAAEELTPAFRSNLERTMDLLAEDDALLDELASGFARDFCDEQLAGERLVMNADLLATLESVMARRTLRRALQDTFPQASRLSQARYRELAAALSAPGYRADLGFGLRAERSGGALVIRQASDIRSGRQHAPGDAPYKGFASDTPLLIDGITELFDAGRIEVELREGREALDLVRTRSLMTPDPNRACLDADRLDLAALSCGPARRGERIAPLGLGGSKKLSDLFIDAKTSAERRPLTPVLRSGERPVWVAGHCIDDACKMQSDTTRVLVLAWTPRSPR